ncbi:snoRNA-binding rRNA-processing protein [Kappamyces sp. JEL0829]|nr:snoRNA-binding rRNA-processing protein [Kappamyces sp. JEL0829]
MTSYKKLALDQVKKVTDEVKTLWNEFKGPIIIKEFAAVSNTHFHALGALEAVSITSSTRIQIYSPQTGTVLKTISRFSDTVLSCWAADKLLVAGDAQGLIQVFDLSSRAILRTLSGHKAPVRCVVLLEGKRILSASDDHSLKIWDLPTQSVQAELLGHTDYVRTACVSPINGNLVLSGSYDHSVKLWDASSLECTLTMNHGSPVEKVLFLSGGGLVVSCGSNMVKIWDIMHGGKLVMSMSPHQKLITTMALDAEKAFLLTGSLDHQVKIIDLVTYKIVHSLKYPAPILAIDVSKNNRYIAVGMTTGLFSIRKRVVKSSELVEQQKTLPRRGTYAHFNRHSDVAPQNATLVLADRNKKLQVYDKLLKSFRYADALDSVLSASIQPALVHALLDELVHRDAIRIALSGRDETSLEPILSFIHRYITYPEYQAQLINVSNIILDLYSHVMIHSLVMEESIRKLLVKVQGEIRLQQSIVETLGLLEPLFQSSL